ncbi:MAG: MbnP family protein [Bacteroidota bacterium]
MKKMLFYVLLLSVVSFFSGCDKDTQGDIDLVFKARFDAEPFVALQSYDYYDGTTVLFQRFNFYIANAKLTSEDGDVVDLFEIDFVDFDAFDTDEEIETGYVITTENIPGGKYTQLEIGLGVPPELNLTKESDYVDTHPLGKASHYWSAWGSYIFTMINAKVDMDGDGMHDDAGLLYHAGSDPVYRTVTLPIDVTVAEESPGVINLDVNLSEMLKDGAEYIDPVAFPDTHDISNLETANKIMDNFKNSLSVQN